MSWRPLVVAAGLAAVACESGQVPLATFSNPLAGETEAFLPVEELRATGPFWSFALDLARADRPLRFHLLSMTVGDDEIRATLKRYGYMTLDDLLPHGAELVAAASRVIELEREHDGQIPIAEMPVVLTADEYTLSDNILAVQFAAGARGEALLLGAVPGPEPDGDEEARIRRGERLMGQRLHRARGALALSRAVELRDTPAAASHWTQAFDAFRASGGGLLWQARVLRAVDALTRDDLRQAIADLEAAVAEVESSRMEARSAEIRERSFAEKLVPYGLIVACLARAGRAAEAERYASMAKARSFHDAAVSPAAASLGTDRRRSLAAKIREAETEIDATADARQEAETWLDYQSLRTDLQLSQFATGARQAARVSPPEIPASWVTLDYFVGADRVHVWVGGAGGLLAHETRPIDYDELVDDIGLLRTAITEGGDYENEAAALYDLLIAPAEGWIAGKDLLVIPHQALHFLPFEVLRRDGRFLVESHVIAYAPAIGLARFSSPGRRAERSFLGVGDSRSLSQAAAEVKVARQSFADGALLLDESAARAALLRDVPGFDVVHVAAHVDLSSRFPLLTRIRLGGGDDVYLFEVPDLRPAARLVVLSGCNTSLGVIDSGDEITALGRAFLENGVETVVVSLWEVEERSTAQFMHLFYEGLGGGGPARALAAAKRQMIGGLYELDPSGGVVDFSHPFHWAAFVAIGNAG